mmetsp:Transcript_106358/g.295931  ORF Transcript_106358/g.295931 Transcript_106358/m.295931 type:complete len:200 (+) Transcript_106358:542-1141(+)
MHPAPVPLALVPAAVTPAIDAVAIESVFQELALVGATGLRVKLRWKCQPARTGHGALLELSHKPGAILKGHGAITILHPVDPLSPVHSLAKQRESPLAVGSVIQPSAYIHIPIRELTSALTSGLPRAELPDVFAPIGEDLGALAISSVVEPLATVYAAVGHRTLGPGLPQVLKRVPLAFQAAHVVGLRMAIGLAGGHNP